MHAYQNFFQKKDLEDALAEVQSLAAQYEKDIEEECEGESLELMGSQVKYIQVLLSLALVNYSFQRCRIKNLQVGFLDGSLSQSHVFSFVDGRLSKVERRSK